MKILVTGSNGFVGKALVKKLNGLGFDTIGFDIADGDIADEGSLNHLENAGISFVFHLAGKTFVPESWSNPFGFYHTNVLGTTNILEFCRKTGAGLTYISSYLYGSPEYLPIDEKHPVKAYNPYSHTKLVAEEICEYYRSQFKVSITILRPFNVYGPGQASIFLIPEMIKKVMDPQFDFIEIMDLRPKRDYIYIDDFVEALALTINGPRGIYNVGSGSSVSVEEVLKIIEELSGIKKRIVTKNIERPLEIFDLYADITKIKSSLNWKLTTSFKNGIGRCIAAY
jgi:nucleoside-diphosphate-sugar epimerase